VRPACRIPPVQDDPVTRRLRELESVTDAALAYLPLEGLLNQLLTRVAEILDVDTAAILLLENDGRQLVARAAKGIEEEVSRGVRIPVGRGFAGRIASELRPIRILDIEKAEILNPLLREKGLKSLLGVPLLVEGSVIGVLHVGTLARREFTDEDADLLQRAGDRAAVAIQSRLSEREQGLADALQRNLIPPLPDVPGVAVAGRYIPTASAQVGGDWYDAFPLPGGRLGLAIGDVVGRGFHAAAIMSQLRSSLRAFTLHDYSTSEVLELQSNLLRSIDPHGSATLMYLVVEPDTTTVKLASAGHLAPLIVPAGTPPFYAELEPSVPLGTVRYPEYRESTLELADGAALLLYTDGLIERPGEHLDDGLGRLSSAAASASGDIEGLCDGLVGALLGNGATQDDAALLVVRLQPLIGDFRLRLDADPDVIPAMRRVLGRWLREAGASEAEVDEVTLACSEASANAIEHAYAPGETGFELRGERSDNNEIQVAVRDWGTWRDPRGVNRGRGLELMEGLMDRVVIDAGSQGTTVRLARRLQGDSS
jgi:serine phosphatase RsbU (regulator of sigma subunit)/anti-sigma regulatory factor (Ser/Thr protein kinase)